jgi:glucoamylase
MSTTTDSNAPGWPGIPPRWTSSAKSGVGTALSGESRVWFTLSHGILNEVYYPRVDHACIRDLGFIVTDGSSFFSEERRHTTSQAHLLAPGVPAYRLVNTCVQGRYRIEKDVLADPHREVVLQRVRFTALKPGSDYHLYALLAPHLGNAGAHNTAWVGDYKGIPMLLAEHDGMGLALACSAPWLHRSAGFVGYSDGWQDLARNRRMTWSYPRAEDGNVALTGEVDLEAANGEFLLALGFGGNSSEAAQRALASILGGFDAAARDYVQGWQEWQESLLPLAEDPESAGIYRVSTAVLRAHESKAFPGAIIASLSIPWGNAKGDDDLGGYHLVWPRDLVETAGGLLACGAQAEARCVLDYLRVTQEADGHWSQNMWLDGTPYWTGVQMDETAFPILLADLLRRGGALAAADLAGYWPMLRRAAAYLVRNGPVTQQDRWEEDPGYSPFTLAAEVAALLAAADIAALCEPAVADYLRETADQWNDSIERWTYICGSDLARRHGIEGYYVRIAPPESADAASPASGFVPIKNRPPGESSEPAEHIIGPDFLALVRFGLRAPDDPRILNTLKVVDALLKVNLSQGPSWHRYNDDGYGEHEDGSAFDGTGIGRVWPLLVGERAHYELAAGRRDAAARLLRTFARSADAGGLLPEQCWDAPDIPLRELFCGRPSGSARPLVWAHAEYIKLLRSLRDGCIFDRPPQTVARYLVNKQKSPYAAWRMNNKCRALPAGKHLRVELPSPAIVHWTADAWTNAADTATRDTGLGVYTADLSTQDLLPGQTVEWTFFWPDAHRWEGSNFSAVVVST